MTDTDPPIKMKPFRGYLFQALLQWIYESDLRPHILVDATVPGVAVPNSHVEDGKITLNLGLNAIAQFSADEFEVCFTARFNGASQRIRVPLAAIEMVYAQENGIGMRMVELVHPALQEVSSSEVATAPPPVTVAGRGGAQLGHPVDPPREAVRTPPKRGHLSVVPKPDPEAP